MTIVRDPDTEGANLGVVWANGLIPGQSPPTLDARIATLVARRAGDLSEEEDAVRRAARDLLRFGKYKPTGRGKPASEYLLRTATQGNFPRIWPAVDICNYMSLKLLVSASVWDADLAGPSLRLRHGRAGESYVFNGAGQEIGLEDLLLLSMEPGDVPIVNPVKDSHPTKTGEHSRNVAAVIYFPASAGLDEAAATEEFFDLLCGCGNDVTGGFMVMGDAT